MRQPPSQGNEWACTFYKMAADEVIEIGRFAFEGKDEYSNYVSDYRQQLGKKAAKTAAANAADSEDTPNPKRYSALISTFFSFQWNRM